MATPAKGGFNLGGPQYPVYQPSGFMTSPAYGSNVRFGTTPAGVPQRAGRRPQTPWSAEAFLQSRGLPTTLPGGQYLGGARNLGQLAGAVEGAYGVNFGQWTHMAPQQRTALYNRQNTMQMNQIFDPETGLPTRLPRTRQEAMQFQLEGARRARGLQQTQLREALSTLREGVGFAREDLAARERNRGAALASLRYGVGMTQRASPYSTAAMISPLLSQQAQTYMQTPQNLAGAAQPYLGGQAAARMSMQYDPGDYSAFMRPEVLSAAGGGQMPGWGVSPRTPGYGL